MWEGRSVGKECQRPAEGRGREQVIFEKLKNIETLGPGEHRHKKASISIVHFVKRYMQHWQNHHGCQFQQKTRNQLV
jgi:hypothetical protein